MTEEELDDWAGQVRFLLAHTEGYMPHEAKLEDVIALARRGLASQRKVVDFDVYDGTPIPVYAPPPAPQGECKHVWVHRCLHCNAPDVTPTDTSMEGEEDVRNATNSRIGDGPDRSGCGGLRNSDAGALTPTPPDNVAGLVERLRDRCDRKYINALCDEAADALERMEAGLGAYEGQNAALRAENEALTHTNETLLADEKLAQAYIDNCELRAENERLTKSTGFAEWREVMAENKRLRDALEQSIAANELVLAQLKGGSDLSAGHVAKALNAALGSARAAIRKQIVFP